MFNGRNYEFEDKIFRKENKEVSYKPSINVSLVSPWNMKSDDYRGFNTRPRNYSKLKLTDRICTRKRCPLNALILELYPEGRAAPGLCKSAPPSFTRHSHAQGAQPSAAVAKRACIPRARTQRAGRSGVIWTTESSLPTLQMHRRKTVKIDEVLPGKLCVSVVSRSPEIHIQLLSTKEFRR